MFGTSIGSTGNFWNVFDLAAGAERMKIDAAGNVGIGVSPTVRLDVSTSAQTVARLASTSTGGSFLTMGNGGSASRLVLGTGSNVMPAMTAADSGIVSESGALMLGSNNLERMRIFANGDLRLGSTVQPAPSFIIEGAVGARPTIRFNRSGTNIWATMMNTDTAANQYMISNPAETVGVIMSTSASGWSNLSDERLKENWLDITNAVDKVLTLRAGTFTWKADPTLPRDVGLIAQDVQAVLPEVVNAEDPEKLGIRYHAVIPLLVAAIKEQQAIIADLQARLVAGGL
jgi:hypothetical protein